MQAMLPEFFCHRPEQLGVGIRDRGCPPGSRRGQAPDMGVGDPEEVVSFDGALHLGRDESAADERNIRMNR
jgi:hypothetical protein